MMLFCCFIDSDHLNEQVSNIP